MEIGTTQTVNETHFWRFYWPMQMGQPLRNPNFSQQQCKCNKRQPGSQPLTQIQEQMH